jgi:hypothetical protein
MTAAVVAMVIIVLVALVVISVASQQDQDDWTAHRPGRRAPEEGGLGDLFDP